MQPLIVLLAIFAVLVLPLGWWMSLRIALAAMFLLTASAHWGKRRVDLIRMVPPMFPRPDFWVTLTGVCEVLGAAGLLIPSTVRYASLALALLLLAIFPANVRAAHERLTIGGRPTTKLAARTAIQVIFLAALLAVFVRSE